MLETFTTRRNQRERNRLKEMLLKEGHAGNQTRDCRLCTQACYPYATKRALKAASSSIKSSV